MNKNRGITLMALIITIIILLILAGILIVAIGSDNGLFARAKQAKVNTEIEQYKENSIIDEYENNINSIIASSRSEASEPTELWRNSNPTAEFSPQTITLSSDDYNFLEVYYIQHTSYPKNVYMNKILAGYSAILERNVIGDNGQYCHNRKINFENKKSYTVENDNWIYQSGSTKNSGIDNNSNIPILILGYK